MNIGPRAPDPPDVQPTRNDVLEWPAASAAAEHHGLDRTATMAEYSKKERADLRKLAGDVYEWELGQELKSLDESFRKWREGKILSSELSDEIHVFHQEVARRLGSMYQTLKPDFVVARGLVIGALSEEAIPAGLREKIKALSPHFKDPDESAA